MRANPSYGTAEEQTHIFEYHYQLSSGFVKSNRRGLVLPDIPKLKSDIDHRFILWFKNCLNNYLGVVGEAPRCIIKEGRNSVILRPDSSRDETKLKEASAETIFKREEFPSLSVEQRKTKLDIMAREMARQISLHAFATIQEAADSVGNVVHAKFSPEAVFELLEKMQIDFEEDGVEPKELFVVFPPELANHGIETIKRILNDTELSKRYKEIIDKKRMEWRAREASRKLVG